MSKIKVCGINDLSCLDSVQKFKPDYLGFITYQNSPRYIDANFLKQAQEFIDDEITPVIVFVNEKISFINEIINIIPNALLQFHGNETDEFCAQFNRPIKLCTKFVSLIAMKLKQCIRNNVDNFINK